MGNMAFPGSIIISPDMLPFAKSEHSTPLLPLAELGMAARLDDETGAALIEPFT